MSNARDSKPGPDPDRLKIDGDWEDRMSDAIKKPVPDEGVPDQPGKGSKPRKEKAPDEPEPDQD